MLSTRDIVHIALFAAIVAALGLMPPIFLGPLPVPITAQSLGPMLAGTILGARRGALALALFLVLLALGLPLLAGGRGGLGLFFGPTAGYLFSWPLAAGVIGWLTERSWSRLGIPRLLGFCVLGGIVLVDAIGIPWFSAVSGLPLAKVAIGALATIPGDLIKAALAASVALTVKRAYPVIGR